MKLYNHMFDIAFTVISDLEDPLQVNTHELRIALLKRLASLGDEELGEAVGPCDTYEIKEEIV